MTTKKPEITIPTPRVEIVPLGVITTYHVYEHELERLAEGSPASVFLNFALVFLSSAVSFLVSLSTTTIKSERVFNTIVIVTTVFAVSGVVLLVLWVRDHLSTRGLLSEIKSRKALMRALEPPAAGGPS